MCTANNEDMLVGYNFNSDQKSLTLKERKIERRFHLNDLEIFVNEDAYQLLRVRRALGEQKSESVS